MPPDRLLAAAPLLALGFRSPDPAPAVSVTSLIGAAGRQFSPDGARAENHRAWDERLEAARGGVEAVPPCPCGVCGLCGRQVARRWSVIGGEGFRLDHCRACLTRRSAPLLLALPGSRGACDACEPIAPPRNDTLELDLGVHRMRLCPGHAVAFLLGALRPDALRRLRYAAGEAADALDLIGPARYDLTLGIPRYPERPAGAAYGLLLAVPELAPAEPAPFAPPHHPEAPRGTASMMDVCEAGTAMHLDELPFSAPDWDQL